MRHYVYLNEKKVKDAVIEAFFNTHCNGASFSEFVKDELYTLAQKKLSKKTLSDVVTGKVKETKSASIKAKVSSETKQQDRSVADEVNHAMDDFDLGF